MRVSNMEKIVFITDAANGIGAGIAREWVGAGAKFILGTQRLDRLDRGAETSGTMM
jgi:NADP-dependent 3-hydroxy acid dehydrogenase YdfG